DPGTPTVDTGTPNTGVETDSGSTNQVDTNPDQPTSVADQPNTDSSPVTSEGRSETVVTELENRFTQQFEAYLELSGDTPQKTIAQTRVILSDTEKATGVKPAIMYVGFVPPALVAN
ncbi:MAG TPA: hypothetical protein DCL61_06105, partial [Cyanobacteria bacterium UBA12227]|nr:hypothetical protein [Cyanobacteria bacterium UBA12227]